VIPAGCTISARYKHVSSRTL